MTGDDLSPQFRKHKTLAGNIGDLAGANAFSRGLPVVHRSHGIHPLQSGVAALTSSVAPNEDLRMSGSDKRKQSLYFPEGMLREIKEEASRQDRSLSWVVQKAWKTARKEVMSFPAVNDFDGSDE